MYIPLLVFQFKLSEKIFCNYWQSTIDVGTGVSVYTGTRPDKSVQTTSIRLVSKLNQCDIFIHRERRNWTGPLCVMKQKDRKRHWTFLVYVMRYIVCVSSRRFHICWFRKAYRLFSALLAVSVKHCSVLVRSGPSVCRDKLPRFFRLFSGACRLPETPRNVPAIFQCKHRILNFRTSPYG